MPQIKLEKRFPNVSTEDFCKIFNEGLLTGLKAAGKNAIPIEWIKERYGWLTMAHEIIKDWERENEHKESD